jgi:hypothetical protein
MKRLTPMHIPLRPYHSRGSSGGERDIKTEWVRHTIQLGWATSLLLVCLLVSALGATPAYAGGVVGTGTSASCTEAALDARLVGGGTVTFNCGGAKTITLTFYKQIADNTMINGGGLITLSGGGTTHMFQVFNAKTLTLQNITLANGLDSPAGAVENFGTTTIVNSHLVNNRSSDNGGAITNYGTLNLTNSSLQNNRAANGGGGLYNDGGSVNVSGTLFSGNVVTGTLGGGGGINTTSPAASWFEVAPSAAIRRPPTAAAYTALTPQC